GAALQAALVPFEVNTPQLVGDALAGLVRNQRLCRVDVDHWRDLALGGDVLLRIHPDFTLLQTPERPHRTVPDDLAVGRVDIHPLGKVVDRPELLKPGTNAAHNIFAAALAPAGDHPFHRLAVKREARYFGAGENLDPFLLAQPYQTHHRRRVEREPALL